MISQKSIQEVLEKVDIVEVISDFVNLKRSGVNYKGLCPFHKEKTPSFIVSPSKQIFKCFGCGEAGNAVSFLMKHEYLTYPEAIRWIAKKYNIELEEIEETEENKKEQEERETILSFNMFAQKYYTHNLFFEDEGKSVGLSYFRARGFTDEIINKFQLGYAFDNREAFTQYALKKGYNLDFLSKTGLTIVKDDKYFDRFWNRVMFPIHSLSGQIIGFAGRTLSNEKSVAKYLNSPETEVFQKRKILYGFYFAKKSILKNNKCYLVEGYTDVLAFHQAGIENTVAALGTALTEEHVNLIHRFTNNLTLIFDGDDAGIKAAFKSIDIVLKEDLNLKLVVLPKGEDPDSFSKELAPVDLKEFIENNEQDFISFKAKFLLAEADKDPYKRIEAIRNIAQSLAIITDPIKKELFLKQAAEIFKISTSSLLSEVNRFSNKIVREHSKTKFKEQIQSRQTPILPSTIETIAIAEEKELIYYFIKYGNRIYREIEEDGNIISETVAEFLIKELTNEKLEFKNLFYKEVYEDIRKRLFEGKEINIRYFQTHPDQRFQELVNEILANEYQPSRIWERRGAPVLLPHEHFREFTLNALLSYKLRVVDDEIKRLSEEADKIPADSLEKKEIEDRIKRLDEIQKQLIEKQATLFGEKRIILPNIKI